MVWSEIDSLCSGFCQSAASRRFLAGTVSGTVSSRASRFARLAPSPLSTPIAFAMVSLLALSSLLLHTFTGDSDQIVAWASTNVANLGRHPVASLVVSTFIVPGGLLPELLIVAAGFALLERSIGSGRTVLVALGGQVAATLLTEYGAAVGARWHLLADVDSTRPDVGVSYAMYAVLAAAALTFAGRSRFWANLALYGSVLSALVVDRDMTSTGHVLSLIIGTLAMTGILHRAKAAAEPARQPQRSKSAREAHFVGV